MTEKSAKRWLTLAALLGSLAAGVGAALMLWPPLLLGVRWLGPALHGLALILLLGGGAALLCRGLTLWRAGAGLAGLAYWAGLAWLLLPFGLLAGGFLYLASAGGDWGFTRSDAGYTMFWPQSPWLELLGWLGPALALLWLGRSDE